MASIAELKQNIAALERALRAGGPPQRNQRFRNEIARLQELITELEMSGSPVRTPIIERTEIPGEKKGLSNLQKGAIAAVIGVVIFG